MASPLERLVALCPVPSRPIQATGERAAARAALGWPIPDHVFEVVEAYGAAAWMGWLHVPSPFSVEGRINLENVAPGLEGLAPDPRALVAFSDPEEALLFVGGDGWIQVATHGGVTASGRGLAEVLLRWLDGTDCAGLPAPAKLAGSWDIPPYVLPCATDERPVRVLWVSVRGGAAARAARWKALRRALGHSFRCWATGEGEQRQDRIYLPELELELTYDSLGPPERGEQLNLRVRLDREDEVKAAILRALSAAGMELVRVEGPRGPVDW